MVFSYIGAVNEDKPINNLHFLHNEWILEGDTFTEDTTSGTLVKYIRHMLLFANFVNKYGKLLDLVLVYYIFNRI